MKYFKMDGCLYHVDDDQNYAAKDSMSELYTYEKLPIPRLQDGYWSGGAGSKDKCLMKPDIPCPGWITTCVKCV